MEFSLFSLKTAFIIYIFYIKTFFSKSKIDESRLNNDFIEEYNCINSNRQQIQDINNKSYVTYFPVAYLAYIIEGFLPEKIKNETEKDIFNSSCFKYYLNNVNSTEGIEEIKNIIRYSAKSYPDFGDEEGCIRNDNAFILFYISFDWTNPSQYNGKFKLLPFILKGYSFYGLCIENIYNCTKNLTESLEWAFNNGPLNNFTLQSFIQYPEKENEKSEKFLMILLIFVLIVIYILIRLIMSLFGLKFFIKEDSKKDSGSSSSEEEEEEEEEEEKKNKENDEIAKKQSLLEKKDDDILSNNEKYPKLYFFYKICSFKISIKYLFKKQSILYDESDLYLITFFKVCSLVLKTIYINMNSLIYTPSKEINNVNFFNSNFMNVLKYSSFSDVIFILCESIIVAYKLMTFIRRYNDRNREPSFKLFINFFLRIIPSFFIVAMIFFFFYYLYEAFIISFKKINPTKFHHYIKNIHNCNYCMGNIKSLIPFLIQYKDFKDYKAGCFQFIIFTTNLFYCYIIVILLTYFSFKIKRLIYDYLVIAIFCLNYVVSNNFSGESIKDYNINIHLLFGEISSTKFTHLFFNYYFLGFLLGLSIFYNNDITRQNSIQNSPIYKPFHFLQNIIRFFYLRSFMINLFIIIITIIIQLLLSVSFLYYYTKKDILNAIYGNGETLTTFDNLLYLNEKNVFAFAFGLMIIIFYTFNESAVFKGFFDNIVFLLFNRSSFAYYSFIEITIYYIYCFVELEVQLNSANLLFITYGILFYILVANIVLIALFEIPSKVLIKKILHINSEEGSTFTI